MSQSTDGQYRYLGAKDPIRHSNPWKIGLFSPEETIIREIDQILKV